MNIAELKLTKEQFEQLKQAILDGGGFRRCSIERVAEDLIALEFEHAGMCIGLAVRDEDAKTLRDRIDVALAAPSPSRESMS